MSDKVNVLILGGGTCALSKFLAFHYQNLNIQTVEIS